MTWFRRTSEHAAPAPSRLEVDNDPDETPAGLRGTLFGLVRFINQNSGRLPGEAVVAARRVTDTLREIIDTSDVRPLDVYAVVSVKGALHDYLPTTLRSYLAVDPDLVDTPRPSGRTPRQSLLEQLDDLHRSASLVLEAAQNQDVDALMTQGAFLRTKFSASDLEL